MYDEIAKEVENGEIHPKDVVAHIRNLNGKDFKNKKKVERQYLLRNLFQLNKQLDELDKDGGTILNFRGFMASIIYEKLYDLFRI